MYCRQINLPAQVALCVIAAAVCSPALADRSTDEARCEKAAGDIRTAFVVCGNPPDCQTAPHDISTQWVANTTTFISTRLPTPFNLSALNEDAYDLYLEQIYLRAYADCMAARH